MVGLILLITTSLFIAVPFGEAVRCYHCYESFNKTLTLAEGDLDEDRFGDKLVPCDKNKSKWNSLSCPVHWPVCVVVSGTVGDNYEVVRSCAVRDFCSRYVPPNGVRVDDCRECNTTLCNDYPNLPGPPAGPGPTFTFNINIRLNLKKYPRDSSKGVN